MDINEMDNLTTMPRLRRVYAVELYGVLGCGVREAEGEDGEGNEREERRAKLTMLERC